MAGIGFNAEEAEGVNRNSSITFSHEQAYRDFLGTLVERRTAAASAIRIREFDEMRERIELSRRDIRSSLNVPLGTISFDYLGNFSTFSPELLTQKHQVYGDFTLLNVYNDAIVDILSSEKLRRVYEDIRSGVDACQATCEYLIVCGGGAPSNKLSENGSFESTTTAYCTLRVKRACDLVLERMEEDSSVGGS